MMPEMMPGSASGTTIKNKRAEMTGAKIEARLDQRLVEPVERGIERQHHERQVDIDEPEHHGKIIVEQLQPA